jgi:uncharacterized phage protein (TIGR02218 family)
MAHYAQGTTTLATCWKATLTNGTVVAATSHDQNIALAGVTYQSVAAYTPSDIASASDLSVDNLELEAFLASPHITEADLHSGIWDYAAIEMFEVNYANLSQGRNLLRKGTLGEVKGGQAKFTAELRGLMQAFTRRIVHITTKECTADLGDARCKVDLAPWTVTGTITAVTNNREFADSSRAEPSGWFLGGKITFTSGLNSGLGMEVKASYAGGGAIELQEFMPFDVAVGDSYTMYAGCPKRFAEDCRDKFNNTVNFRGFPHLPGSRAYAGPVR